MMNTGNSWIFGDLLAWLFPKTHAQDSIQTVLLWAGLLVIVIVFWRHVLSHLEN
jgi:hypothetical protein